MTRSLLCSMKIRQQMEFQGMRHLDGPPMIKCPSHLPRKQRVTLSSSRATALRTGFRTETVPALKAAEGHLVSSRAALGPCPGSLQHVCNIGRPLTTLC